MYVERHEVDLTTDASGDVTAYTPVLSGRIRTILYIKDGATPFDNTVDFTITAEKTAESILAVTNITASTTWAPRQPTHSTAGAAALYAAGGAAVNDHIALANDRVKIVVAQGGNAKKGKLIVIVG